MGVDISKFRADIIIAAIQGMTSNLITTDQIESKRYKEIFVKSAFEIADLAVMELTKRKDNETRI